MASRLKNSYFSFESVMVVDYYLTGINFSPDDDDSNFECITAIFNPFTSRLDIYPTDCQEKHTIVCRKVKLHYSGSIDVYSLKIQGVHKVFANFFAKVSLVLWTFFAEDTPVSDFIKYVFTRFVKKF